MLRKFCLLIVFMALLMLQRSLAERETVHYFYLNACASCDPQEAFANEFFRLTGKKASDYEISYHNVFTDAGSAAYEQAVRDARQEERTLPMLLLGDTVYAGDTAVSQGLEAHFGFSQRDNRSIVYFLTATVCESCLKARTVIESLPLVVPIWLGDEPIPSTLEIIEINISSEPDKVRALFERYNVPDEKRFAPTVFMGETYLSGEAQIGQGLLPALKNGAALGTPALTMGEAEKPSVTLLGAVAAGFAAGFNPCALSMLLTFLGMLLSLRKNPLLPGLLYLGGKFVVYMGIGLLFSQLWMQHAPSWLPLASRILLTLVGGLLIAMNLLDAAKARAGQYGRIRNQLPSALRLKLRGFITRFIAGKSGWLIGISAALIGAVVAGGEFFCAGQIYVAVLIADAGKQGAASSLTAYCLAFLAPSMGLLLVAALTRKPLASSDWILSRLPAIKICSAVVMAVIMVYTWVAK